MVRKFLTVGLAVFVGIVSTLTYQLVKSNSRDNRSPSPSGSALVPEGEGLDGYYSQQLEWSGCNGDFECTTFNVPIDYANPANGALQISVIRKPASGSSLGSLILNPGGPGGSGIEYTSYADYVVSDTLRENFDIVGFDPRGVGQSTPVECLSDEQTDEYIKLDGSPDNQTEIDQAQAMSELFAKSCATNSPDIYKFLDTVSATKDIDILRALLGDEKLNWLGKSYGTFLGATYADLFPDRVGRMLLDGAIDPTLSNEQLSYGQALGFELALERFVDDCATRSDCPLSASGEAGVSEISNLLIELDANPVTLDDGRIFSQAMGTLGVLGSLYDKVNGWPELRTNLSQALAGDFSGLATSVDFYTGRQSDGSFKDNSNDAINAVNCLDRPDRATTAKTEALASEWEKVAPNFGAYLAWSNLSCTYWQTEATGSPKKIIAPGTPTILVVGTVNDPATPYQWAQALASQLSKGVLLTLDGDGHTAYYQGSNCIDEVVDAYFLTGEAEPGIICTDGP
ncbi:MAG: alpha/beta hydrolase [Actinobacteria bacterium]|nr:alpha/beta hydrolase [Actinomycetota bacterium]